MRSLECLLSAEARNALIEAVLARHARLSIRRKTDIENILREDWRIGSRIRGERLYMFCDPTVRAWHTLFGFGSFATMIRKIVSERNDCAWTWPEAGLLPEDDTS
jgi:hypothetical protein